MITKNKRVLVRTYSAGVHFGTLISHAGQEVRLKDARRLWSWTGALSQSQYLKQSKIFEKRADDLIKIIKFEYPQWNQPEFEL